MRSKPNPTNWGRFGNISGQIWSNKLHYSGFQLVPKRFCVATEVYFQGATCTSRVAQLEKFSLNLSEVRRL